MPTNDIYLQNPLWFLVFAKGPFFTRNINRIFYYLSTLILLASHLFSLNNECVSLSFLGTEIKARFGGEEYNSKEKIILNV